MGGGCLTHVFNKSAIFHIDDDNIAKSVIKRKAQQGEIIAATRLIWRMFQKLRATSRAERVILNRNAAGLPVRLGVFLRPAEHRGARGAAGGSGPSAVYTVV